MMQILKMAFRDLGRNRRRSFFSALAALIPAIEAGRREPAEALHFV